LTTALEGGEGSASRPGRFLPSKKDPVPIVQEAEWAPGSVWTGAEKSRPPPGFDPWTVQPVASRYTVYATRPNRIYNNEVIDLSRLPDLASTAKYGNVQYTGRVDGIGEKRNFGREIYENRQIAVTKKDW